MIDRQVRLKNTQDNYTEIIYENMIHDIKTPLMIMYMNNQLLENMKGLPENAYNSINSSKRNWYRIMKIITDASDTGKITNGKLVPKFRNCDVVALLKKTTEATKILADRKDITLSFYSGVKSKIVAMDKDMLERIVLNLLSNAFKDTCVGGRVEIVFTEIKDSINIIIRNNEKNAHIDEWEDSNGQYVIEELESASKEKGLSLSIVTQLSALLGGGVCIKKFLGGTEVLVSLPYFVLDNSPEELKFYDDFYSDNIVQIELSDEYI